MSVYKINYLMRLNKESPLTINKKTGILLLSPKAFF